MSNKKLALWKLVFSIVIILLVGIGLMPNLTNWNIVDLLNSPARQLTPQHLEIYEKVIFKIMAKDMDGLPKDMAPEIMRNEGVVTILHGIIREETNSLFDRFVTNSLGGKAAQIIIAVYTTNGDPILINVLFDRVRYFAVIDSTRVRYYDKEKDYENLSYDYLKIITNPESESKFVILTKNAELTFEQLRCAQIGSNMESIDSFQLFSYSK
jgi:hypothetical protein